MTERVSMNVENGVADVKLTRGDKMNALDQAMFEGIIETGAKNRVSFERAGVVFRVTSGGADGNEVGR